MALNIRLLKSNIHTPTNDTVALIGYIPGYFTPGECDRIRALVEQMPLYTAGTGTQGKLDAVRDSRINFAGPDANNSWVFDKLEAALEQFNAKYYHFDLSGFYEGFQIAKYPAPSGHYDWHVDLGTGRTSTRKLSLSVQLSDESEYAGGGLEFFANDIDVPRKQGSLVVFPSFLAHRVSAVTEGTRMSLVSWVGGPPFR